MKSKTLTAIREKVLAGNEQTRRVYHIEALNALKDIELQTGQPNLRFVPFKNEGVNIVSVYEAHWVKAVSLALIR